MSLYLPDSPRFVCDDNLGKLARYLRVGGYDTAFDRDISDSRLLRLSLDENRHILTRDRALIEMTLVRQYFLIEDDAWPVQLRAVMQRFKLVFRRGALFQRCLEDNAVTEPVEKEQIPSQVFPYTYAHYDTYRRCPSCGRVYWRGSHVTAMLDRLRAQGIDIVD